MTFPTIPTVAAGRVLTTNQADTSATRTFPALSGLTKNAGDRLIAIIVAYQTSTGTDAAFSGWTEGFGEVSDRATSTTLAIGVASKISTGAETAAPTVTQAATITGHASMILLSIPGAHDTTIPAVSLKADGTAAAADPGAHNPGAWDVEDTLWIAVAGSGMTSGTGSWTGVASAPTNYTDFAPTATVDNSTVGQVEAAVAFRQNAVASEDVGPFTVDVSNARNSAVVIAVRPAPGAPVAFDGAVEAVGDLAGDMIVDKALEAPVEAVGELAGEVGVIRALSLAYSTIVDAGDTATPPTDIVDAGDTATPATEVYDVGAGDFDSTVAALAAELGVDKALEAPVSVVAEVAGELTVTAGGGAAVALEAAVEAVAEAAGVLRVAERLRYPRPEDWATCTEYHVSNSTLTVNIPTGTNGRVVWDEVTHKRVTIIGGRNVYIVGAEIDVDATDANPDLQNALWIHGQDADGIIWIEGLYAYSTASPTKLLNDGVKTFSGFSNYTAQNCRIQDLTGTQAGYHSDAFQLVAGCKTLRVDRVSCVGEFQCFMFNPETTGLGDSGGWNETWFGRVDTHVIASGDATARSWNFVTTNPDLDGPIHLGSELYVEARLSSSITSSIAPAANFDVTGTAPNQVATPNANWTITVDGVFKQQSGAVVYTPAPLDGGNVGLGYLVPSAPIARFLDTSVEAVAQIVGDLSIAGQAALEAPVEAVADVAGALTVTKALAAPVEAVAELAGELSTTRTVTAAVEAIAAIAADLTVSGQLVPTVELNITVSATRSRTALNVVAVGRSRALADMATTRLGLDSATTRSRAQLADNGASPGRSRAAATVATTRGRSQADIAETRQGVQVGATRNGQNG